MKNSFSLLKNKIASKYLFDDNSVHKGKTADINVLLNRVKLDKKKEIRKKMLFTAATSVGVVLFGSSEKIKEGDRFYTPIEELEKSKKIRTKFGSKGLKKPL